MSQPVFIPASDEMLEMAMKQGQIELVPYAYQTLPGQIQKDVRRSESENAMKKQD